MKKIVIISLLLVLTMLISSVPVLSMSECLIGERGVFLDDKVAATIGLLFVASNVDNKELNWDVTTTVEESVPLYFADGDLSAYCFTLCNNQGSCGYIVVSAWSGTSLIIEYSSYNAPLFKKYLNGENDKVYFMGGLQYTYDEEFAQNMNISLTYSEEFILQNEDILYTVYKHGYPVDEQGGFIENPITYLNNVYGSYTYTIVSQKTLAHQANVDLYGGMECAVHALAGIIYTSRYNITGSYPTYNSIYSVCMDVATGNNPTGFSYYTSGVGIDVLRYPEYYNDVMDYYGCTWSSYNYLTGIFNRTKNEINDNRATCVSIAFAAPYTNHSMEAYGYVIYQCSTASFQFLKVRDIYGNVERYLNAGATTISMVTTLSP